MGDDSRSCRGEPQKNDGEDPAWGALTALRKAGYPDGQAPVQPQTQRAGQMLPEELARSSGRLLLLGGLFPGKLLLSLALTQPDSRFPDSAHPHGRWRRGSRPLDPLPCAAAHPGCLSARPFGIRGGVRGLQPAGAPGIIGVNAGAALAVTLCAAAGFSGLWAPLWAFAGAFAAVLTLSLGARAWGASRGTVLLMGVALNSLLNALSDTVITFRPELAALRHDFKVGDLAALRPATLLPAGLLAAAALLVLFTLSTAGPAEPGEGGPGLGMDTSECGIFLFLAPCWRAAP